MNRWLMAATALICGLIPCGIVCFKGRPLDRMVGFEMASVIAVLVLMLLAEATRRPSFFDLGLTLTVISLPGTLLFIHYLERWK